MEMDELERLLEASTAQNWSYIDSPSFTHRLVMNGARGPAGWLDVQEHSGSFVYLPDLRITVKSGLPFRENFTEAWHARLPDPGATGVYVDVHFNGSLVRRYSGVVVDGGRCMLPLPNPPQANPTIPAGRSAFFRALAECQNEDYDNYMARCAIQEI